MSFIRSCYFNPSVIVSTVAAFVILGCVPQAVFSEEVSAEGGGDVRRHGPRSGARRPGWRRGDSGKGGDNRKEELASPQTPLRVNPADPLDERTRRQRGSELLSIIMFVHLRFIESNSLCFVPVMTLHLLHGILVTLQCFRIL